MTKKMLIDATHEEETRVAVVDNGQLEEFDYESMVRKQIKGGIYLAKVTRVEPSLQAAFVNYGGNRHGFLPFSEIHPDYFRIPISDREALLEEQKAEFDRQNRFEDDDDVSEEDNDEPETESEDDDEEAVVEVGGADKPADDDDTDLKEKAKKKSKKTSKKASRKAPKKKSDNNEKQEELEADSEEESSESEQDDGDEKKPGRNKRGRGKGRNNKRGRANMRHKKNDELVDEDGAKPFRFSLRNKYKIQEVIKRGQIMLVQVSKEERGNKGAAVTSYLSLPGRYCVLMPNSPRGGGVSRKIGNFKDRKRMREILKELTIPDGMSVILRTAGVSRTKAEIKRDLDYLMRLWNTIREETLNSNAPALINEEGNLIKRSIRDLYTRDIDEVLVAGEKGYKTAKEFMKMLVPSHAKKVKEYVEEKVPLFHKYKVEQQISEIGEMTVTLKSGGYLVINPTEALVSVDVNSGKATKERHIEETALKTNLEAASEVARQLRLRDLGGLVVIDFIDMEERRNNRKVENRLRDALSSDRARIQVGRISSFGLLELSRQRLNPSLTEAQFDKCPHCDGSGTVKSMDFAAITALRSLIEEGIKGKIAELSLNLPNNVAVYILNNKRQMLADIEAHYDFRVHIKTDDNLKASEFRLDVIQKRDMSNDDGDDQQGQKQSKTSSNDEESSDKPKKSRRRGRRGGRRHNKNRQQEEDNDDNTSDKPDSNHTGNNPEKKKSVKKSSKKSNKKKSPKASNDDGQTSTTNRQEKTQAENIAKEYEVVNEAPSKKKKGWWNRLMD
jgi:ribonuclease E